VSTWRFQPATLNGQPVDVEVNVEVRFQLYRVRTSGVSPWAQTDSR
jgi:hypothetical protein